MKIEQILGCMYNIGNNKNNVAKRKSNNKKKLHNGKMAKISYKQILQN